MTENQNSFQCYHNNRGYCQYGDKCRYQHYKDSCQKRVCKEKECKYRHPKLCKYRESCKFLKKQICSYKHDLINKEKDLKETANKVKECENEVQKLRSEVFILMNNVQMKQNLIEEFIRDKKENENMLVDVKENSKELEDKNSVYKNEISKLKIQLEKKNETNRELENKCKYLEIKLEEHFKCKECDFRAIRKIDLLNHIHSVHKGDHEDTISLKIQQSNSQIVNKDGRIEKLNAKIWDLENKHDVQRKEQNCKIKDQMANIVEYKNIIKNQKDEIEQLKNLACDKCNFETKSISNLIMHLSNAEHGEAKKSVTCGDCDFTCQKEYDLHTHISVKHSAKPDPMHLSNFKFTKKNNLTKKTYSKEC